MSPAPFIMVAYTLTGLLIAALCIATWLRARRVKQQLGEKHHP